MVNLPLLNRSPETAQMPDAPVAATSAVAGEPTAAPAPAPTPVQAPAPKPKGKTDAQKLTEMKAYATRLENVGERIAATVPRAVRASWAVALASRPEES